MSSSDPLTSTELNRALARDEAALKRLVERLIPVVQARVARVLLRRPGSRSRSLRPVVEDLVQEVFVALFSADARVLRDWQPERGLSLANFVGLVAERHTLAVLRSARRNPWTEEPMPLSSLDSSSLRPDPEEAAASREGLQVLLARLQEDLSPLGWKIFELLFVLDRSVQEVVRETHLSADAVYAWRSRLRRRARALFGEVSTSSSHVG